MTATVTAVAPGAGTPTGSVTFTIGNRSPVTVPLVDGTASTTIISLSVGTHPITAAYPGSADFTSSTGTDTHTVTASPGALQQGSDAQSPQIARGAVVER